MADNSKPNGSPAVDPKPKTEQQKLDEDADQYGKLLVKFKDGANVKAFFDLRGGGAFASEKDEKTGSGEGEKNKTEKGKEEKKEKDDPAWERAKQLLAEQKLDLTHQDRSKFEVGLPSRPEGYGAKYLDENWQIAAIGKVDNPTSLKGEAWAEILSANKLLFGWVISDYRTLRKARRPAFELKPLSDAPSGKASARSGDKPSSNILVPIPDFEVYDEASISIKETKNELERSLASNGFSSTAIQGSVKASGWGASLSVSAGYSTESQSGSSSGDFSSVQEFTATYNFPRTRVYVDELDLQLTAECLTIIKKIQDYADKITKNIKELKEPDFEDAVTNGRKERDRFFTLYGHIFATSVQLGGQLTATRSATSLGSVSDTEKRDSMKFAAAASFEASGGGFGGGASASYSNETNESQKSHQSAPANSSRLAWSARGGNTLLCANPPEWANSLAGFQTWRTLEQSDILTMPDLISRFPDQQLSGFGKIQDAFRTISQNEFKAQKPSDPLQTYKVRLETLDGRQLFIKDGRLCLSAQGASSVGAVEFTILSADPSRRAEANPTTEAVFAGRPSFLVTGKTYARESSANGAQIPGLWVDRDGSLREESQGKDCICRWSFLAANTKLDFSQRFNRAIDKLADGAEVKLYCHSSPPAGGYGSWTDEQSVPYWAPPVMISSSAQPELKVASVKPDCFGSGGEVEKLSRNVYGSETPSTMCFIDWPSGSEYDLIARDDDNWAKTWQCLKDFDRGTASAEQQKQLLKLRQVFCCRSVDKVDENVLKNLQSIRVRQEWVAVPKISTTPMNSGDSNFKDYVRRALPKIIENGIEAWKTSSDFKQEAIFRLRYI